MGRSLTLVAAGGAVAIAAGVALVSFAPPASAQAALVAQGQKLYQTQCGICHAPAQNKIGPMHKGIVNRAVATVPGFRYSAALKKLGGTWTPARLDTWLANPQAMAKGSTMVLRVNDPNQRKAIIAYLATLK
ncbi:c-type cytochrome [Sphingomonas sp.]|uniref:c-type cytochrome n=1 Tax=Sphingomonas sp. TaxID=28214 RepID=UPI001D86AB6E|nr:c-type cytochrome [Sphingomonas sp.]MBX9797625.1 c-type cytochrome [Sphingomonas sp.]